VPLYSTTIDIAATPARAWEVLADVERWPVWTRSIDRITPLQPGPLGVGSKARVEQPKLRPAVMEVSRWEPGHGFTWESNTPGLSVVADHVIEPTPGGCRVTLSVRFGGLLGHPVGWVAGRLTRNYIAIEASGLKVRCEQSA